MSANENGTDIYIDTVTITNNNGAYFTGVTTTVSLVVDGENPPKSLTAGKSTSSSQMSYMTSTMAGYGLKFTIQLCNRHNIQISGDEMAKYSVEICSRFLYEGEDEDGLPAMKSQQVGDIYIVLPSTALAANGSVYVGHDLEQNAAGNSSAITVANGQIVGTWRDNVPGSGNDLGNYPVYIPDQFRANSTNAVIATDFILKYTDNGSTTLCQLVGKNSTVPSNGYFGIGSGSEIPAFFIDYNENGSSNTTAASTDTGGIALKGGHYSFKHATNTDGKPSGNTIATINYRSFNKNNYHWRSINAESLTQSIVGDPHIFTLTGDHYEFDYLGSFRLIEDTINGEKLIINGQSELGPGRWKVHQYIRKLFIQQGDKYMLIDMGFRGQKVKVLEEKGFLYNEEELEFDKDAKRYSFSTRYRTLSRTEPVTDDLPALVRNQISFSIDDKENNPLIYFKISNVNQYNLQPGRLHIRLANQNVYSKDAKGCLINRIHAPLSKLEDIKSLKPMESISFVDISEIPELEIDPAKRNKEWC